MKLCAVGLVSLEPDCGRRSWNQADDLDISCGDW